MFDPSIGRWLEMDPIAFDAGDANLYRAMGNNPTNATDPSGLMPVPEPLFPKKEVPAPSDQVPGKVMDAWAANKGNAGRFITDRQALAFAYYIARRFPPAGENTPLEPGETLNSELWLRLRAPEANIVEASRAIDFLISNSQQMAFAILIEQRLAPGRPESNPQRDRIGRLIRDIQNPIQATQRRAEIELRGIGKPAEEQLVQLARLNQGTRNPGIKPARRVLRQIDLDSRADNRELAMLLWVYSLVNFQVNPAVPFPLIQTRSLAAWKEIGHAIAGAARESDTDDFCLPRVARVERLELIAGTGNLGEYSDFYRRSSGILLDQDHEIV